MKNRLQYIALLLALLIAVPAMPASKKKKGKNTDLHFVSMWGGAGYSGLVNSFSTVNFDAGNGTPNTFDPRFVGGGGGLLGAGYEMHHKRFMFRIGPEFRAFSSLDKLSITTPDEEGNAMPGYFSVPHADYPESMELRYTFTDFRENQAVGQLMVPIMFGGNFDRYYFLAGAKIGYTVFDFWHQRGRLTSSVKDNWAIDEWEGVPSHDLVTDALITEHPLYAGSPKGRNTIGMAGGLDFTASAEFGVNLNDFFSTEWNTKNEESKHPWRMRAGLFLDYGMPVIKAGVQGLALVEPTDANVQTNSLLQSTWADKPMNSLLVGVHFTALFQLNKPKQPNPRFSVFVSDAFTSKPLPTAKVTIAQTGTRRKPQQKAVKRDGIFQGRYAKGLYNISSFAPGYLPSDTVPLEHTADLKDTVRFALIPKPKYTALVHDANTEQILAATIVFTSRADGTETELSANTETKEIVAMLNYGDVYDIRVKAPDYHDTVATVRDLYASDHFYLRPIKRVRRTLLLKNMYFATDKTNILSASEDDLMTLYTFLAENPKIRVLITGHTDSQGTDAYNQRLSEGRAASVKAEMVSRGIAEDRIDTDGKGESEPIDTNDTEEGRQNNRRVQVTVINAEDAVVDEY